MFKKKSAWVRVIYIRTFKNKYTRNVGKSLFRNYFSVINVITIRKKRCHGQEKIFFSFSTGITRACVRACVRAYGCVYVPKRKFMATKSINQHPFKNFFFFFSFSPLDLHMRGWECRHFCACACAYVRACLCWLAILFFFLPVWKK